MAKTGKQIQGDIINLLKDDIIGYRITGEIYRGGYRPRDSIKEDIEVVFTGGLPTEIEQGVVTILIYCPDIDLYSDGVLVEDGQRTEQLERYAQDWVESLTCEMSNYKFKLQSTIDTISIDEIHQHAVSVSLEYEYFGDDDDTNLVEEQHLDLVVTGTDYFKSEASIVIET